MINFTPVNAKERAAIDIRPGDTVRVWQKIEEKEKTRLQAFEGLVIARKHGTEPGATFTVRKIASGVGVEKIFPLYSPVIDKIEIVRRAKVRRAKLYYIRGKTARQIRRKLRGSADFVPISYKEQQIEEEPEEAPKIKQEEKPDSLKEKQPEAKTEVESAEEKKTEKPKAEKEAPKEVKKDRGDIEVKNEKE